VNYRRFKRKTCACYFVKRCDVLECCLFKNNTHTHCRHNQ